MSLVALLVRLNLTRELGLKNASSLTESAKVIIVITVIGIEI